MQIKITAKMKNFLTQQNNLGYVATSDTKGRPNLAPKALMGIGENTLLYGDLFIDRTAENIRQNNQIAIATIDPIQCSGYQFKGTAEIITRGPSYEMAKQGFAQLGFKEPIHAIELDIDEIFYFSQGPESKMEAA